jgi:hypothetical protein
MIRSRRFDWGATRLVLGLLLAWGAMDAQPLHAQAAATDAESQYQTTVSQAVHEFGLSNWAEARALFRRAHQLSPSARTWRGMGMAAFELKMYVDAQRELQAALSDTQRPLTEEQRTQVVSLFEQTKSYVGRYHVTLEPAGAKLQVDGQDVTLDEGNVLLLSLGAHTLGARAAGHDDATVSLKVEGGEDAPLPIKLSVTPPPTQPTAAPAPAAATAPAHAPKDEGMSGLTVAGWVLLGTAAVAGGSAAAFWFIADSQYNELDKGCGSTVAGCTDADIADSGVETSDLIHGISVGLAGAALVGSVVCFVMGASDSGEAETAAIHLGPGAVTVRGSF